MKPLDKLFLGLQISNKIFTKRGDEFQSFFELVMEKALSNFQKIRPYGNKGDAGNDGYINEDGVYYQVYAPITPKVSELEASKKLINDFQKLQKGWNDISKINKYIFVFNDKYLGSTQQLEASLTDLRTKYTDIKFELLLAKDLENTIYKLDEADILTLGFILDQRQAISITQINLDIVRTEIDRENYFLAQKSLENVKDIVFELDDENLSLEYELLKCKCLQINEKNDEAKKECESIILRYPEDSQPILFLAEIYLNEKDFEKNEELLIRADKIYSEFWLLKLLQLIRRNRLGEKFTKKTLDDVVFPNNPKIKTNFYRLFAQLLEESGDETNADSFIEKSIYLNPDRFSNFLAKLGILDNRLYTKKKESQRLSLSQEILDLVLFIETKFTSYGEIRPRNKAILNSSKIHALFAQGKNYECLNVNIDTFGLLFECDFDIQMEQVAIQIIQRISLPEYEFTRLIDLIINSKKKISDYLSEELIGQFLIKGSIFTDGKRFFQNINIPDYLCFIIDLENKKFDEIVTKLKNETRFAFILANTLRNFPDLRRRIINLLPDDKGIQKEKLLLLLNFDEEDYDDAYEIVKQLDLSKLDFIECIPVLKILKQKEAWDFEIIILEKLIKNESNEEHNFNLSLQLFTANLNLDKYQEAINIGVDLLKNDFENNFLDSVDKVALLNNTFFACFERGKVNEEEFKRAKSILERYTPINPSFEFKVGIESEIYLLNDELGNALKAIIDGVKIKQILSHQEYARLYFPILKIANQTILNLDSLEKVEENTFVKLSENNQWYFIGSDNALDSIQINKSSNKYPLFIDKNIGDIIVFPNTYGPDIDNGNIELIFRIEKYIFWQTVQNFQELAQKGTLDGVQMIQIPHKDESINPENLIKFLEDLSLRTKPVFDMYCKENIPLAVLAVSEGSLANAIGRITQENQGFINFSNGGGKDLERQKSVVRKIIDEKKPFYIDGSSAFFLSESGLLLKIYPHLSEMKIPRSVINSLANISDRFRYLPGQSGHMGFAQGKITISSIEESKREQLQSTFLEGINLLESNPRNIKVISRANKVICFSEREIPEELCDACVLAQMGNVPVLTEDPMYLSLNEIETHKKAPESFSSWALIRELYEKQLLSFNEYLEYFSYLSFYRFRFLSISVDDINKAVFGESDIYTISPEKIRYLNLKLTFSEEYGVPPQTAFSIIGKFILRILLDNSITSDIAEKIFFEIVDNFPTKISKKDLGQLLLRVCYHAVKDIGGRKILPLEKQSTFEKIDYLLRATEINNSELKLWTPK